MNKPNQDSLRIFLIGFNKCGTTSFHEFFQANGLSSVHWYGNELARCLRRNLRIPGIPPLFRIDRWRAYSDLIAIPGTPWNSAQPYQGPLIEANAWFPQLHRAYPRSLFILNTRDRDAWLQSRLAHDDGRFAQAYLQALHPKGMRTLAQLKDHWLKQWDEHHQKVKSYSKSHPEANILIFHLDHSDQQELIDRLMPYCPILCPEFPHVHRTLKAPFA